jgi:thiamine kinase-like enzyme
MTTPGTRPTTGARIYLLSEEPESLPTLVAKVFRHDSQEMIEEAQAIRLIQRLGLRHSSTPKIRYLGKVDRTGEPLLISSYMGEDLESVIAAATHGSTATHESRSAAFDGVSRASRGLQELHAQGPHLLSNHSSVLEYFEYELNKLKALTQDLESESPLRKRLEERVRLTSDEADRLARIFSHARKNYERVGVKNPSMIHGDAHPGNLTRVPDSDRLGIFDAPALIGFADGHGDPLADVGRFSAGIIVTALERGTSLDLARQLQERFLGEYFQLAGLSRAENRTALKFHQLRFYGVVLSEALRHRLKVGHRARRQLIELVLREFESRT